MPANCPVCDRPLSEHPDGLACCPFCGGRMMRVPQMEASTCAQCTMCYARGPLGVISLTAKTQWNRRAPHAETERLRARVKELESLRDRCIRVANNAIWFDDSHDYGPALRDVCEAFGMDRDTIGTDYIEEPKGPAHD